MTDSRAQVKAAVRATWIESPHAFTWFGRPSPRLSPSVKRALTPKSARDYLLFHLELQLYADFYRLGWPAPHPVGERDARPPARGFTPFVQQLSAANASTGSWQEGWQLVSLTDGQSFVQRAGLTLTARRDDCDFDAAGATLAVALPLAECDPTPGARLRLRFPKELIAMSPGFYIALG